MFERLFLASTALGLISLLVSYDALRAFAIANGTSPGAEFVGGFGGLLWNLLMWFFIARRASNIAKWIFVVMMALGLVFMAIGAQWSFDLGVTYILSVGLVTVLQVIATVYLFRRDAVAWLKSGGKSGEIDAQVFG
jgi:hypothetical protein